MAIRVALQHRTTYRFDRNVGLGPHEIRLRPAPHCRTPILGYSLNVAPDRYFLNWQQDPYGNWVARLVFTERSDQLDIRVDLTADMTVINPFDFFVEPYAEFTPFTYAPALAKELIPFLETAPAGPRLAAWLERFRPTIRPGEKTVDMLVRLNQQLQHEISYLVRMEPGVQPPDTTLSRAQGSCRDTGLAARADPAAPGPRRAFRFGVPDPAHGGRAATRRPGRTGKRFHRPARVGGSLSAGRRLDRARSDVGAARGRGPHSSGVLRRPRQCRAGDRLHRRVRRRFLVRDAADARPRRPAGHQAVFRRAMGGHPRRSGEQVDADLAKHDVRLTQGGEPTFVSVDDMEGPEWNYTALSPKKRELAETLLRRLGTRFAAGGFLHTGQGKWYPGEPLPRWAIGVWWRTDGQPLWRDATLIADTRAKGSADLAVAQRFVTGLAERLGLAVSCVITAFEDVPKLLAAEAALPSNADPLLADLAKPDERARLARLLLQGLDRPAGFVLPLRAPASEAAAAAPWHSSPWPLKRERLYVLPGDSPIGLRLPLSSLPDVLPKDIEPEFPVDPFAPRDVLPGAAAVAKQKAKRAAKPAPIAPRQVIKTALCVEVRDGHLNVFMPPLMRLEDYVELLAHVEAAAGECRQPVVIEGYTPPRDPRVRVLNVTPDPGVIEVNVHPASTWDELCATTEALYEDARQSRLSTEKFMLDGRHTGTGGGNHVTLGGATAADSPLLRRPDLLQSLITYWQNHPALSYLFSGTFIGPTSQSPRVDEARDDRLYELEIAFQQMRRTNEAGEATTTPWLVDRLLRHLLTDLTGNTHRAEFSIDKLYSPDTATGRLGLLEFRAFEMPPHPRMSLVQTLLLRALVARFWREPYRGHLVRWGTALHDRWLLPHFVAADMRDVVADLVSFGYPLAQGWFDPFVEFRFPRFGTIACDGVTIEVRQAIEPWHVLGEEVSGTGTARYVDSSVERLQVKVTGMIGARHWVACNGRRLPLASTGIPGEYVGGVRFRAWSPPSALHPTIGVHAPLVFDLVDIWAQRALGGCTYHVAHPGGRNYDTFPVNANEAEARRVARFWAHGHTPGAMALSDEPPNPATPTTLDLRWDPR